MSDALAPFSPKKRSLLSNLFLLLFVCAADGREESSLAKLGFPPHPCLLTLISQPCQPCHPYPSLPPLFLAIISQHSHPCLIDEKKVSIHCKLVTPLVSHQSSIIIISEEVLYFFLILSCWECWENKERVIQA